MTTIATPRAGRREWAGLAVLMLPVLLVSIDNTVLNFALPAIARDLRPSAVQQLWIVDVYPLVLAGLLVAMGALGDRFGRRRILLVGASGFGVVSVLAAFATDPGQLLAARLVMGLFGAAIMPATLALLRTLFADRGQRRVALAIWASGFSAGSAIGPLVGGALLEVADWGAVFLIAVPFLLPLVVLVPMLVPDSRDPDAAGVDPLGIVFSALTLAPLVYAVKHTAIEGPDALSAVLVGVSVVSGVAFVRRMLTAKRPMLDVRLFAVPSFTGAILVNLVSVLSLVGFLYFASQHLQLVAGLAPFDAALVLVPGTVLLIVAGLAVVRVVKIVRRPGLLMVAGLAISGSAYAVTAIVGADASVASLAIGFGLLGVGVGAAETLSNDLVVSSVPVAQAGAASAVSETAYELGAVLGTSVLGSILAAVYRAEVVVPREITGADAETARETLGGAVDVAASQSPDVATRLIEAAGHAFDTGVVTTSWIGVLLMAAAVVLTLTLLRRERV